MSSASSLPPAVLADLQGNVYPGFKKPHQAYLFVRFPNAPVGTEAVPPEQAARSWLAELNGSIARADEVSAFNNLYRLVNAYRPRRASHAVRATWVNVGFTYRGLSLLTHAAAPISGMSAELQAGLYGRATALKDPPIDEREHWLVGASPETESDAVVIVAADLQADLYTELARQQCALARHGLTGLVIFEGASLGTGREHFGFFDHATDPVPVMAPDPAVQDGVLAGELILGLPRYPRAAGAVDEISPIPHPWMAHGSYLVIRRLQQHVGMFRDHAAAAAEELTNLAPPNALDHGPMNAELFEAKCIGRWHNGVPLGRETGPVVPPDGPPGPLDIPNDYYANDPTGRHIPRFAHVRKVHPRPPEEAHPERHRLFRRGISYGPELPRGAPEDHADRGVIFAAYQASLREQFEFIMQAWANPRIFPKLAAAIKTRPLGASRSAGEDPIIGVNEDDGPSGQRRIQYRVRIDPLSGGLGDAITPHGFSLPAFITMTGGGYFFSPGLAGLTTLAGA